MRLNPQRYDRIIEKYMPVGWTFSHSPFPDQACLGMADPSTKIIYAPGYKTTECLLLKLHEIGHIVLGHTRIGEYHYAEDMSWRFELQAERWAFTTVRKEGIKISPSRLRIMKAYVRGRYQRHLAVCKLYKVEPKERATKTELNWMEL